MFTRTFIIAFLAATMLAGSAYAHDENPVTYWNTVAIDAIAP